MKPTLLPPTTSPTGSSRSSWEPRRARRRRAGVTTTRDPATSSAWFLADAGLTAEILGPDQDAEILAHGFGLTDIAKHRWGTTTSSPPPTSTSRPSSPRSSAAGRPGWRSRARPPRRLRPDPWGTDVRCRSGASRGRSPEPESSSCPARRAPTGTRPTSRARGSRLDWYRAFRRLITVTRPPAGRRPRSGAPGGHLSTKWRPRQDSNLRPTA